jgi:hypothetical protein
MVLQPILLFHHDSLPEVLEHVKNTHAEKILSDANCVLDDHELDSMPPHTEIELV